MKEMTCKLLLWTNYTLFLLYICCYIGAGTIETNGIFALSLSSLLLMDSACISACSPGNNKVVSRFCGLLAADSWYILLASGKNVSENLTFAALSPLICYLSIRFALLFFFQESAYRFRRLTNIIFLMTCIAALAGLCVSGRVYACFYGIQFLASWGVFLFLMLYHRKWTVFVLKSERNYFLFSALITITVFLLYTFATAGIPGHISNFGVYLPLCLFCMSIHGIVYKTWRSFPFSSFFSRKQAFFILCTSLLVLGLLTALTGGGYAWLLLLVNALAAFLYLCNILLGWNLEKGSIRPDRENSYYAALQQLHREELLKKDFADFLHDDILQDLLSVKNMMTKAGEPDIQNMIAETLDNLNTRIRGQMQDYHPVIRKNLTLKENYRFLITTISQSFPERPIAISFDCADTLFLVEPYDTLVYRLIKELLTNIYKHSDGSLAQIALSQINALITLEVSDNGTADAASLTSADKTLHKGIASITEQLHRIEGTIGFSTNIPHGIRIYIQIPMKGDVSYQYFISR